MMRDLSTWLDEPEGYPERYINPLAGSAVAPVWPGFLPHFMMPGVIQHPFQEMQMFDPLRFHWPYPPSAPFLLPYPQGLPEPQLSQDPRFMDPVNRQQSFLSDPWFLNDPGLSSSRMADFHPLVDSGLQQHLEEEMALDRLQSVDLDAAADSPDRMFPDDLTDFMFDVPPPTVCSRSSEEELPSESPAAFMTLENPQSPEDEGQTQQTAQEDTTSSSSPSSGVSSSSSSNQSPQSYQAACCLHLPESPAAFVTLENSQSTEDDGQTQETAQEDTTSSSSPSSGVSSSSSSNQSPQSYQAACCLNETRDQMSFNRPRFSSIRGDGGSQPAKPCNCSKSKCLKFYCSCFSSGAMCNNCNCTNCHNDAEHLQERERTIQICLGRDPYAFGSVVAPDDSTAVRGSRHRGCNCRHTGCLKNYCECFKANIRCSSSCNCDGCSNYDRGSQGDVEEELNENKNRCGSLVLPGSLVEAVCVRLMLQAVRVQGDLWSNEKVEQVILEEFGSCLSEISRTAFEGGSPSSCEDGELSP